MSIWLVTPSIHVRTPSFKSSSSSSSSSSASSASSASSSSSQMSHASTIEYGHESFETFEPKVVDLARLIPQLNIISTSTAVKANYRRGGCNYRIISVTVTGKDKVKNKGKDKAGDKPADQGVTKYILRIPRRERNNNTHLSREVAVLYFLEVASSIPVPKTIAFDLDGINGCPIELPYVLQTHVAGMPLGQVFNQMDFGEKKQFISKLVDLYVKMDRIRFERAGVLGPSSKGNGSRAIEVASFDLGPESDKNDCYRTYPQQMTRDMLLSQFECWKLVEAQSFREPSLVSKYIDRFTAITLLMERKGWLGDNKNTLFHPDLSPRHIFVVRAESKFKAEWVISGIIDWDAALSVPRVMSNRVPSWLWRWGSKEGYDAREEGGDNNNPEDKDREALKHQFETEISAALPKFLEYAYQRKYQLLRKLCRFAIWGLRWEEDIKRADEFFREWNNYKLMVDMSGK